MRTKRTIGTRLLIIVGSFAFLWGLMVFSNRLNESVPAADTVAESWGPPAPTAPATPTSAPPPLPPGFPSMEFPPPKIDVPAGQPQPIATKFGLTYDIPADWRNFDGGVAGWNGNSDHITYGAPGFLYGQDDCPEAGDDAWRAMSGATGRRGVDLVTAVVDEAARIERVFPEPEAPDMRFQRTDPVNIDINGRPAVRMTVTITGLHREAACVAPEARFDIVATPALATANVMLLVVQNSHGVPDAADEATVEGIIATLRPT